MYTIMDYINWRGDLSFDISPFNEIDNYIVSKIGTPDFNGIIPSDSFIPIDEAVDAYFATKDGKDNKLGPLASTLIVPIIKLLPQTRRYSGLEVGFYTDKLDIKNNEQFCALTILFPDGKRYVSFRGTDNTLAAWKENFYLAISDCVPAQKDAIEYLSDPLVYGTGELIVGGHSKGGNLAVYAASMVNEKIQKRIIAVYNNDGPGFRKEFYQNDGFKRISEKVTTIVSQNTIVGTLLEQDREPQIVKSCRSGVNAHDGFTWETSKEGFIRCERISRASEAIDTALDNTLADMTDVEKKEFVDELFDTLTSTGAVFISDFSDYKLRQAIEIAKQFKDDKKVQGFIVKVIEEMFKDNRSRISDRIQK